MLADLHCHTTKSDGSINQEELVKVAKILNLDAIAITDHDVYTDEENAKKLEGKYGVKVICGAEISAFDYNKNRLVHILCYMSKEPDKLTSLLKEITKAREFEVLRVLEIVKKLYPITIEMVKERAKESETIYKQHIMQTLVDIGYSEKIYSQLQTHLFSNKSGIAKTSIVYPDVFEVLKEISNSKGIPVLAHPTIYDSVELIPQLSKHGLKGIEIYYPRIIKSEFGNLVKLSDEYDLIKTGGTDFHGGMTDKVFPLGTCTTSEIEFNKLMKLSK